MMADRPTAHESNTLPLQETLGLQTDASRKRHQSKKQSTVTRGRGITYPFVIPLAYRSVSYFVFHAFPENTCLLVLRSITDVRDPQEKSRWMSKSRYRTQPAFSHDLNEITHSEKREDLREGLRKMRNGSERSAKITRGNQGN